VATGLQAAHAAGLVHRDIKPGNLLINRDGRVKISDFGISQVPGSSRLTQTGMLVGTPAYLAPERAIGGEGTPASDLYSLGVVAYQCLTGKAPFEGEPFAVALAHVQRAMPPLPPSVPPGIAALVGELTAKDPAARPSSAAEVALRAERLRTDPFRANPLRSEQLRSDQFRVNPPGSDQLRADQLRADQFPAAPGPPSDVPAFQAAEMPALSSAGPPVGERPSGRPTAQDSGTTGRQRREQPSSRAGGSFLATLLIAAIVVAICLWALLAMHGSGPTTGQLPDTHPPTRQTGPAGAAQPRAGGHPGSRTSGGGGRHRSGARGRSRGHAHSPGPSPSPSPSLPLPTPLPTPSLPLLAHRAPQAGPAVPEATTKTTPTSNDATSPMTLTLNGG
jgi:eukaryotic-like serine/threonine-protein kinase